MAGFGRSPFGRGPFGKSDVGRFLIIDSFPVEYLEDSAPEGTDPFNDKTNPLLQFLKTYANSVSKRRDDIDGMSSLIDYETASSEILILLGEMLGLNIDGNDPEFLKRSFIGNASQWLQIKSTKKGYQVRGLASGFVVTVENFWRIDESYIPLIPPRHLFWFIPVNADPGVPKILHTDAAPGVYVGTPTQEDETYAKSSYVKVIFEVKEPRIEGVNYNTLLDLVIDKINDVVGIHHEVTSPEFRIHLVIPENITTNWRIDEAILDYAFHQFQHYDLIPADIIPTDQMIVEFIGPVAMMSAVNSLSSNMAVESSSAVGVDNTPQISMSIIIT